MHAKRELSDYGILLARELLKENYSPISTELLLTHANMRLNDRPTSSSFSGLHCASFFGIVEVVAALLEVGGSDLNDESYLGFTPLSLAAHYGHEEVVKILLEQEEVNPDKADQWGNTPLSDAASNGHEGVVKILLGREGQPGQAR